MNAEDFLNRGKEILSERGQTYDPAKGQERSMAKIVLAFGIITGKTLTEVEGWEFMACVKQIRAFKRPAFHEDSWQDFVNYAALGAEAASKEVKIVEPIEPWGLQGKAYALYKDNQIQRGYNVQPWTELDHHDQEHWVETVTELERIHNAG